MFVNGSFQSLKRLYYKLFFCVLCGKCKDIYDDRPTRFDLNSLRCTDVDYAGYYEELNITASVHVVEHDLLERFQKVFLKVERHKLLSYQKFIG